MKSPSFGELCKHLATEGGGFTLWTGAGASIAASGGTLPGWGDLVSDLGGIDEGGDFPDRLERLSQKLTHRRFRRELRERLIASTNPTAFDHENLLDQAVIAARAGALVSFNIEFFAASAHCLMRGTETFLPRTFRQRTPFAVNLSVSTNSGLVGAPIYFPHGLLLEGSVVLTRSEYDRHVGSLAMTTAVHLCIGGDLVILGMSLADAYLRAAILQNRQWLRSVYWLGEVSSFQFHEWARVADVTCVQADNSDVWSQMAAAMVGADTGGMLRQWRDARRDHLPEFTQSLTNHVSQFAARLDEKTHALLLKGASRDDLRTLADFYVDTGHPLPGELVAAVQDDQQ